MSSAILAQGLSKTYQTSRSPLRVLDWLARGRRAQSGASVHALEELNFEVSPGEAVGLIGRNGAGKSTLLRVIAGIHQPSAGTLEVGGSTRAVLDLQSLFIPLLSGRENLRFGMRLYGIPPAQTAEVEAEAIAFSELGEAIDAPLQTYSSGMMLRLGFSLAIARAPEILLIDEILLVGDESFRQKCYGKARELLQQGTTVLFASHDLYLVEKLCPRTLWLERGQLSSDGPSGAVIEEYQRFLDIDPNIQLSAKNAEELKEWIYRKSDVSPFQVRSLGCVDGAGDAKERFQSGDAFGVEALIEPEGAPREVHIIFFIHRPDGTLVAQDAHVVALEGTGAVRVAFRVDHLPLGPGDYYVHLVLSEEDPVAPHFDYRTQRASFTVDNSARDHRFRRGLVCLDGKWESGS